VEAGQLAVFGRELVVDANEFGQHLGDAGAELDGLAMGVRRRHTILGGSCHDAGQSHVR
jgi:hypothetical protein